MRQKRLNTVQAARGIAALLVAVYHSTGVIKQPEYAGVKPFGGFFSFGHAGVEFFFVLSGFIIFHIHRQDLGMPSALPSFAWKRAARVLPIFWFIMLFVTAKAVLEGQFRWAKFINSALLLPQPPYPMLGPSWTLVHEALFYALFGLAILNWRTGRVILGLWLASAIWSVLAHPQFGVGTEANYLSLITSPYNTMFFMGIVVAWVADRDAVPFPRLIIGMGLVGFVATGIAENAHILHDGPWSDTLVFGAFSAVMLAGLASAESCGLIKVGRIGHVLGELSYPLYLVHGIVLSAVASAMGARAPGWITMIVAVSIACIAALALNRLVERPISSYLRRIRFPSASERGVVT